MNDNTNNDEAEERMLLRFEGKNCGFDWEGMDEETASEAAVFLNELAKRNDEVNAVVRAGLYATVNSPLGEEGAPALLSTLRSVVVDGIRITPGHEPDLSIGWLCFTWVSDVFPEDYDDYYQSPNLGFLLSGGIESAGKRGKCVGITVHGEWFLCEDSADE